MSDYTPTLVDDLPDDLEERRSHRRYQTIAATLRDNPGKWHIVGTDEYTSMTSTINGGRRPFQPAGAFEAKSYRTYPGYTPKGGKATRAERIYARYVPSADTETTIAKQPEKVAPSPADVKPALTPMQRAAVALAIHHANTTGGGWESLTLVAKQRRSEVALVALDTVYDLIAGDMQTTIDGKVA
jgi:hypothetical protein